MAGLDPRHTQKLKTKRTALSRCISSEYHRTGRSMGGVGEVRTEIENGGNGSSGEWMRTSYGQSERREWSRANDDVSEIQRANENGQDGLQANSDRQGRNQDGVSG